MQRCSISLAFWLTSMALIPAWAHHSAAMFDTSREVVIEGIVTAYDWKNPHIYMTVELTDPDGKPFEQAIEAGAPSVLLPLGLTPSSLTVGERVVIRGNPNKNGPGSIALGRTLTKADGTELPLNIAARSVRAREDAVATSLAGTWFAPLASFRAYLGASNAWNLTDKGLRAKTAFDIRQASYADCIPVTAPTLMIYPVTTTVEITDETAVFEVDWMTSRRVVYLDGRAHPVNGEATLHGHSTGHWEDGTLVVDTVQYAPHTEGMTLALPSGAGKHTVERFSLSEDGRHMNYEVVLEDPEFLREPVTYGSQLEYRPDLAPTGLACDRDVARRYLSNE